MLVLIHIIGHKWFKTHWVLRSCRRKIGTIYEIIETVCPPSYHHADFVATYGIRYVIYWNIVHIAGANELKSTQDVQFNITGSYVSMTHKVLKSSRNEMGIIQSKLWQQSCCPCLAGWTLTYSLVPAICHFT